MVGAVARLGVVIAMTVLCSAAIAGRTASSNSATEFARDDAHTPATRIHYGDGSLQFADLSVPPGPGPHPVAVFIHGGCWLSQYDITPTGKLTAAFARHGIATWSLEYRRIGDDGGGWPATFLDVGRGADHLRAIAANHGLDLSRVIVVGHSAGGQLALWLAARSCIPTSSPLHAKAPLAVRGVLALAPAADLGYLHDQRVCGGVVDALMAGSPRAVPEHYRWADPIQVAPEGVPQVLVIGRHDAAWAPVGLRYFAAAQARGDDVRMVVAPESGHFEMIDPDSSTWSLVLGLAFELLDARGDE